MSDCTESGSYEAWLNLPSLPFQILEIHTVPGLGLWSLLSHFSDPQRAVSCQWIMCSTPAYTCEIQALPHSVIGYLFREVGGKNYLWVWIKVRFSDFMYHIFIISCHWPLSYSRPSKITAMVMTWQCVHYNITGLHQTKTIVFVAPKYPFIPWFLSFILKLQVYSAFSSFWPSSLLISCSFRTV